MEPFSDEHSNLLFGKEFIVKIDAASSTPYLIVRPSETLILTFSYPDLVYAPNKKFCTTAFNMNCCILVTDTKKTWAEVLTRKELARRWRDCNRQHGSETSDSDEEEEAWRTSILELLNKAHTLGNFADMSFEVVESNYSDFAFELDCETFKWRWETCFLGYKTSAEILSKHLIVPLITTNHLAFSSADPVSELSEIDLEKAVDKMGRTAKRSADIHFRNAMSKPRVATTVRRVASVLNSISDLPGISFVADKPDLQRPILQRMPAGQKASRSDLPVLLSPPQDGQTSVIPPSPPIDPPGHKVSADSATESDEDGPLHGNSPIAKGKAVTSSRSPSAGPSAKAFETQSTRQSRQITPLVTEPEQPNGPLSDSDSSPVRPVKKKQKQVPSTDEDSETERRKQAKGGAPAKRGTRQPIKRGGKRF